MDWLRANFTILKDSDRIMLIRDDANKNQTMSVTNDVKNVIKWLYDRGYLKNENKILYSICTDESIDILHHDGKGNFTGYEYGFANVEEFNKNYCF